MILLFKTVICFFGAGHQGLKYLGSHGSGACLEPRGQTWEWGRVDVLIKRVIGILNKLGVEFKNSREPCLLFIIVSLAYHIIPVIWQVINKYFRIELIN